MKFKLIVLLLSFTSFCYSLGATEPLSTEKSKQVLIKILGDEFIARCGLDYLNTVDTNSKQQILDNISKEVLAMDCFEISDFFGNPNNKDSNNREFDITLWQQITTSCPDIMKDPGSAGLATQVVSYFIDNI